MLTALTVKNVKSANRFKKFCNIVRGNSIVCEIKSARGVALRHITYINRSGKINWNKLSNVIGDNCGDILCGGDIALPEGFSRFDNGEYKSILAVNMGINILSELKNNLPELPVGFYNPSGSMKELIYRLAQYNNNIIVISDDIEACTETCDKITRDCGAVITVSENRLRLADCRFVIAPERIREPLSLSGNAVVISGFAPDVCIHGLCYYDFGFRLPNDFDAIKPDELSAEYFAGALYSKARQYELGSIVPLYCSNSGASQTPQSIIRYLSA